MSYLSYLSVIMYILLLCEGNALGLAPLDSKNILGGWGWW